MVFAEHFILKKKTTCIHQKTTTIYSAEQSKQGALYADFSLHVSHNAASRDWSNDKNNSPSLNGLQESTPSLELTSQGMKIRLHKSSTDLQILNVCLGLK
ncbi:hypothetical protein AVEN_238940-1 [Araneus ventricosus]|uniref:Uncharacterized protein n=1 Tax=Araneus ventricosus TaxID=182803 RepID=A0A4Y2GMC3_ARAVE|nr:hypothetical protein AVEN_238940-1 [Araneus ventricosus]